ncbi:hypothetical protein [Fimbriiglobus ruber]|uniref:hypothetical protein n=1 Tax=Fimbriiglobus ruber TaxID=1908690 RepID=UPI000B4B677D|nr:hypothetical protein [Fimbriiglobus ruber]
MNDSKGPIEILCKEIGFRFDKRLETVEMLVAFVSVLVSQVAQMRHIREQIAGVLVDGGPSADSGRVLKRVEHMLTTTKPALLIRRAESIHRLIHQVAPDDAYPCDHLIDMLSSCVSAIRFGLEKPCHSRHAAEAASHIWKHVYGIRQFDSFTSGWEKEWARAQFHDAMISQLQPLRELKPSNPA